MIGMDFDTLAMQVTELRLRGLGSQLRRRILLKVGNAAAKPLVKAIKAEPVPEVSGTLAKEVGKKVKAYAAGNVVFVVAGSKSKKVTVDAYEYYRKQGRNSSRRQLGARKVRLKTLNPAHYAHLAGPGRKSDLIPRVRKKAKQETLDTIRRVLIEEVAKS